MSYSENIYLTHTFVILIRFLADFVKNTWDYIYIYEFTYQAFYIPMLRRSLRVFIALIADIAVAVISISIVLGHFYDHSKLDYVLFTNTTKLFIHQNSKTLCVVSSLFFIVLFNFFQSKNI